MKLKVRQCKCRTCKKLYDPARSRADYKGYCTQECLRIMALAHGWNKAREERERKLTVWNPGRHTAWGVLRAAGELGDVEITE